MTAVSERLQTDAEFLLSMAKLVEERHKMPPHIGSFIFGGFVRDMLLDKPPHDIDVSVPNCDVAYEFIEQLNLCGCLKSLETKSIIDAPGFSQLEYYCHKLVVKTPRNGEVSVDLTYSQATSLGVNSMGNCDFTVDNLQMDHAGKISTRIKACQIGLIVSEPEWTARCIRDVMKGKLVWMIPDRFSKSMGATEELRAEFMQKMRERLQKMQDNGFVLAKEKNRYLTSFRLE